MRRALLRSPSVASPSVYGLRPSSFRVTRPVRRASPTMLVLLFALLSLLRLAAATPSNLRLHRGRPMDRHGLLREPRGGAQPNDFGEVQTLWFSQRLDHFNPTDGRRWRQRYMINGRFQQAGGPVFLMLGGEGEASSKWLSMPTHIMLMAKRFGALVFQLEHRYYGQSRPTPDLSTANLAFLTSQQALADAAAFRNAMAEERFAHLAVKPRWVVFGGSYSGSLAAWFKLKYPHLAAGAVASSAPMEARVNFIDYMRVVRDSLGVDCSQRVADATRALTALAAQRASWSRIDQLFLTCTPFNGDNTLNVQNFFESVAGLFAGVVQYNRDERLNGPSNITVDTLCDMMTNGSDPLAALASVAELVTWSETGNQSCFQYDYDDFVRELRNVSYSTEAVGARQWTYQTCVEFGFFQSSDASDQPFGRLFPVELFVQQCRDIFDDYFNEVMIDAGVRRTNTEYGGRHPQLRNVTFPNGSVDPWHALGVVSDLSRDVTADYIIGTAHCADMYPPASDDDPALTVARRRIEKRVAEWVGGDA